MRLLHHALQGTANTVLRGFALSQARDGRAFYTEGGAVLHALIFVK